MKLFIALEPPYHWISLGARNVVRDSGIVESLENYRLPRGTETVIGVAPGTAVVCHGVHIPGKKRRYAESALGYALEDRLTQPVENLHFKLLDWQPDGESTGAVVAKIALEGWVENMAMAGIRLDAIIPEYFLLPLHPGGGISVATNEGVCHIRESEFRGLSLDEESFGFWWDSRSGSKDRYAFSDLEFARQLNRSSADADPDADPADTPNVNHWDIGPGFCDWMQKIREPVNINDFNLLAGAYAPRHSQKSAGILKVSAFVALLTIVLMTAVSQYELKLLEHDKQQTDQAMRELFSRYFPDQPYLDRPRSQLTNLINDARSGQVVHSGFAQYLDALSQVAPRLRASIDEVGFRDERLTVLCSVQDLSSLDRINQAFNQLPGIRSVLESSGARDGRITGRFIISTANGDGT